MSVSETRKVIIVGAGQAGGEVAQRLRQGGFVGEICLIGQETSGPYQRPPLSKKYLSGELEAERLLLRPADIYAQEAVTLWTATRALGIDRTNKRVRLNSGREMAYDALVLSTGARPRLLCLPGANLAGSFVLRSLADVDAIRPAFRPGARLVVIGAGFIGLEVAAVARRAGLDVTVVENAIRPLARVTNSIVSDFFLREHTAHGVRFMLGSQVVRIKGVEHVTGVQLPDGLEIPADLVISGIGVTPETALAQECGLKVENGIVTDRACRTSDPAIYAIGDCASRPAVHYDNRLVRLESVHNAIEGAKIAVAAILGLAPPTEETPWFWSDQYDLKLQIAGLFGGYDHSVLRGSTKDRSFAVFYFRDAS